jgi:integrase
MKVTIEDHDGRLRLRWLYQGKRFTLGCGVPNTLTGRAAAQMKKSEIERDLISGYFDITLLKYRPRLLGKNRSELTVCELFDRYSEVMKREKHLTRNGYQKYKAIISHLKRFFGEAMAQSVTERRVGDFSAYLSEHMVGQTAKQYLFLLRACWSWAKNKYHLAPGDNPWSGQIGKVNPAPRKRTKLFAGMLKNSNLDGNRNLFATLKLTKRLNYNGCR